MFILSTAAIFGYLQGMTSQIRPRPASPARPLAALVSALLFACGDAGGDTVSGSAGSTGAAATGSTGGTNTMGSSPSDPSATTDLPTSGSGSQGATGSETTVEPTSTTNGTATSTSSAESSTTDPVQTNTGGTDTSTSNTSNTTGGDTTTTSTTGDDTTGGDSTTNGVEPCACPDIEVPLDDGIFVLSDNSELWKFYPESNTFLELGAFNCGGMTNTFSMAVDRLGFAWVMFNTPQGEIWKVDVTDVSKCSDPGYNQGQQGINYFGMAFVSNNEFDQCDQIYGNTFDGFGGFQEGANIGDFLSVDPDTLLIQKLGKTNFNGAEVTGTGDGRAFMFGGANPAKLVEVDKANGAFLEVNPLGNLELTNAFAFAFFAGDFYMFTESDNNQTLSKVTHYDYDGNKALTTVVPQAPFRIVGAGVSTCAPFVPM